jgi:hypothetical protein
MPVYAVQLRVQSQSSTSPRPLVFSFLGTDNCVPHLEAVLVELKKERKRLEKAISDLERAIHYQAKRKPSASARKRIRAAQRGKMESMEDAGKGWSERQHRPDKAVATQNGAC